MNTYQKNMVEEQSFLTKTLNFLKYQIDAELDLLDDKKARLIELRRDMWENTAHSSEDFDKMSEISQYLPEITAHTASYANTHRKIEVYRKMLPTPYFGRFDFHEQGYKDLENIYIGLSNAIDKATHEIYVYDWRAPISSIFYRYELGTASYKAPIGTISGEVSLKRQYKIRNSELKYFFDCDLRIYDEILQDVLSKNTSGKMKNIVETIQREQDMIIRDTEHDVIVVQGVAGSGKTSIALHRIAFLLYAALGSNIKSSNFLIISPHSVFSTYISGVLPELGEENVEQGTFDEIVDKLLEGRLKVQTRNDHIENLIDNQPAIDKLTEHIDSATFKGSPQFMEILERLIYHYEHEMLPFEDIYFENKIIFNKQQLRNLFLNASMHLPTAKRLKRIETIIMQKVHPLQKARLAKLTDIVSSNPDHMLEIKPYSRLLAIREASAFQKRIRQFTEMDYLALYKELFSSSHLLCRLMGIDELPEEIAGIVSATKHNLEQDKAMFEDCAPLAYLKLRLEGNTAFQEIKHVVIDEAQDYTPLQYAVFALLFTDAKFTIIGDICQSVESSKEMTHYENILNTLNKDNHLMLQLTKSYRSSYEITDFCQNLLFNRQEVIPFERHEAAPHLIVQPDLDAVNLCISEDIERLREIGHETVAVICKNQREAFETYHRLKESVEIKLINDQAGQMPKGAIVISSYIAKGLEFDAVIVHNASNQNYTSELDRRLLYIACTRALHSLSLYSAGETCDFLQFVR